MSKENKGLLINALIVVLVTVLITILYITLIPKTTTDKIFNRVVKLDTVALTGEYDKKIIKNKYTAKSLGSEVGTVYRVEIKNGYYKDEPSDSMIELYIGIDNKDRVSVEIGTLNQSSWVVKGVKGFVNDNYNKILEQEVYGVKVYDIADANAGATAQDSISEIKEAIIYVIDYHFDRIESNPYIDVFGEGYVLEEDDTFIPTAITLKKQVAKVDGTITGYLYTSKAEGVSYEGGVASVEMHFAVDVNNMFKMYEQGEYNHTGSYYRHVKTYLNKFIDTDLTTYVLYDKDVDGLTSATNTVKVISSMLVDLGEVLK